MEDRDTKGDLYEYMLGKIATAGQNGQFRTPRHIIQLMVEMTAAHARRTSSATRPAARRAFWSPSGSTCDGTIPNLFHDRQPAGALPPRALPRLRLRQHHAAHRQHEHAAARRREPRHRLPRLARAGPRRRRRRSTPWCWPIRRSPGRSTTRTRPRTCSRSSRPRRPSCSSWRSSSGCSSPAAARRSSCRMACSSARATRTRRCASMLVEDQKLRCSHLAARRRLQALRRRLDGHPVCSPRPTPAAPIKSGSTTSRPTAGRSTTSGQPLLSEEKLGAVPGAAAHRGRARQEQPARRAGTVAATRTATERERPRTAQSFCVPKADIAAQGLRPEPEPLQGSGPRRDRPRAAEEDPRRA